MWDNWSCQGTVSMLAECDASASHSEEDTLSCCPQQLCDEGRRAALAAFCLAARIYRLTPTSGFDPEEYVEYNSTYPH